MVATKRHMLLRVGLQQMNLCNHYRSLLFAAGKGMCCLQESARQVLYLCCRSFKLHTCTEHVEKTLQDPVYLDVVITLRGWGAECDRIRDSKLQPDHSAPGCSDWHVDGGGVAHHQLPTPPGLWSIGRAVKGLRLCGTAEWQFI
jgi:hypothetical protein